jgi:hypothetical protein
MALFLDEVWIKDPNAQKLKEVVEVFTVLANSPESVAASTEIRVVAGPWLSNEEAKVILVLDIVDHTPNVHTFGRFIANGLFERRRLTPIVDWAEAAKLAQNL